MLKHGRRIGAALLAGALAVFVLVVGGVPGAAEAESSHTVRITHGRFSPSEISVAVGDTVTWSNDDHDGHSVTADDGSFDSHPGCSEDDTSQCLPEGETWSHTFTEAGRYPYHSRTEGQKGTVIVRG
jgi:plastocyanin